MHTQVTRDLSSLADAQRAKNLSRFFKTGPGEYGEGDVFLGIPVGQQRMVAKKHVALGLSDVQQLLDSRVHEHRLTGLMILVGKYRKADDANRKEIADFYLRNTRNINNWDLVDLSAPNILGHYLLDKDRSILYKLARGSLWERRIAVLATFMFIKDSDFDDAFKIAEMLLDDKHDLIHKAVGWMLREVGKRDAAAEKCFLDKHLKRMPRTMLRYAIEKFPEQQRQTYLGR